MISRSEGIQGVSKVAGRISLHGLKRNLLRHFESLGALSNVPLIEHF